MENLEKFLSQTQKPDVTVKNFRQDLRRSLLNSHRYQKQAGFNFRRAFYLSSAVAVALITILGLFILHPSFPAQIHYAVVPGSGPQPDNPLPLENGHGIMMADRSDDAPVSMDGASGSLVRPVSSAEIDKEFVRYLAQRELQMNSTNIQPVNQNALYSVNQYRLDNGQLVAVFTQIPKDQIYVKESY